LKIHRFCHSSGGERRYFAVVAGFGGIGVTVELPGVITTGMNWLYATDDGVTPSCSSNPVYGPNA